MADDFYELTKEIKSHLGEEANNKDYNCLDARFAFIYSKVFDCSSMPDIIVESIAQDPDYALLYAQSCNNNAPDVIVESIAKDSDMAYQYAVSIYPNEIPEIILKSI